jgi:transposase
MAQPGRPKARLVFSSADERDALYGWSVNPPNDNQSLARRARIVLACGSGYTNRYVAQHFHVSEVMVSKWRQRYLEAGLEGLRDAPRSGVPRSIADERVDALIEATLVQSRPGGAAWTQESMAEAIGISGSSVGRLWRDHGIDPHRVNIVQLSADPAFIDKVRDVVGLYLNPPEGALVLGVDERSPIPTAGRRAAGRPGRPEAVDADSPENGQRDFGAPLVVAAGRVIADPTIARETERDRDFRFRQFLLRLDQLVPKDLDVHVIVVHSSTKMTEPLRDWLLRNLRFQLHFAPTYRWWMKVVERWLTEFANQGSPSTTQLAASITDWIETGSEDPRPFVWLQSAEEIVETLATEVAPISGSEQNHGGG